ncbi:hypothetical protein [Oceanobacillus salinisoli]|nr:hypothetical protein [Oceanobacillus salinisoli]
MGEQEQYKLLLKKVIDDTEENKIQTAEQLIQKLIIELSNTSKHATV